MCDTVYTIGTSGAIDVTSGVMENVDWEERKKRQSSVFLAGLEESGT